MGILTRFELERCFMPARENKAYASISDPKAKDDNVCDFVPMIDQHQGFHLQYLEFTA